MLVIFVGLYRQEGALARECAQIPDFKKMLLII